VRELGRREEVREASRPIEASSEKPDGPGPPGHASPRGPRWSDRRSAGHASSARHGTFPGSAWHHGRGRSRSRAITAASPTIHSLDWGRVDTDHGSFRDAKLWPGGARAWDWTETGTAHRPGIQPVDVAELVEHGARTVVLSRGQQRRLGVMDGTVRQLREQGVAVEVLDSPAAVARYNELAADGHPVAALIHSTC
jgi:hypothetical protein